MLSENMRKWIIIVILFVLIVVFVTILYRLDTTCSLPRSTDEARRHENHLASFPPKCIVEENEGCGNESLPELLFVAGIEGSGHHLIKALFSTVVYDSAGEISRPYIVEDSATNLNLMDPGAMDSNRKMGFAIIHRELFRHRLTPFLEKMNRAKNEGKKGLLLGANSFPMGIGGILATARPDLLVLKYFDCVLYRLKVIVVKRHPLLGVLTTIRKLGDLRYSIIDKSTYSKDPFMKKLIPKGDYPYVMQARIVEDELIYLDQQVRQLRCNQVHFVDTARVHSTNLNTKDDELRLLARFLQLSDQQTQDIMDVPLRRPQSTVEIPPNCVECIHKVLYDFFEERKIMWPLMAV